MIDYITKRRTKQDPREKKKSEGKKKRKTDATATTPGVRLDSVCPSSLVPLGVCRSRPRLVAVACTLFASTIFDNYRQKTTKPPAEYLLPRGVSYRSDPNTNKTKSARECASLSLLLSISILKCLSCSDRSESLISSIALLIMSTVVTPFNARRRYPRGLFLPPLQSP